MKNAYGFLVVAVLCCQVPAALALTPAEQAYQDGQAFAATAQAAVVSSTSSASLTSTVNSFNPKYYGAANTSTASQQALFQNGNGNTQAAGSAKLNGCKTGAVNPDPFLQQNCDAINFMANNHAVRPQFTISQSDPLIQNTQAIVTNAGPLTRQYLGLPPPSATPSTTPATQTGNGTPGFTACATTPVTTLATTNTQVCNNFTVPALGTCILGEAVVVNGNTAYQCNQTNNAFLTQACDRTSNTVVTQPQPVPAIAVSNCQNGSVMIGNTCQSAAMAATVNYSCSAGSVLPGNQCQPAPTTATLSYSCVGGTVSGGQCVHPAISAAITYACTPGSTLNGTTCVTPPAPAQVNYSCDALSVLNGTQCQPAPTTATLSYACGVGTLSGTSCVQPAISPTITYSCQAGSALNGTICQAPTYQPPAVTATKTTGSGCLPSVTVSGVSLPLNKTGVGWVWSPVGYHYGPYCQYLLWNANQHYDIYEAANVTVYSCPTGYTLSGTSCYPPKVTPPPIAATATTSCPANYSYSQSTNTCVRPSIAATASYSCPVGTLSGTSCIPPPVGANVSYTCPAGGTVSGASCVTPSTAASASYSCPAGGALSGTSCVIPTTPASASYSCPVGSLVGTNCFPPPIGATVSYTCPVGALSGTTCTPPATTPQVTYSCGAGTSLSGTTCIANSVEATTWIDGCTTEEATAL